jgi:hypothetical protein
MGTSEGTSVGSDDIVGAADGLAVGNADGRGDGMRVGTGDGLLVTASTEVPATDAPSVLFKVLEKFVLFSAENTFAANSALVATFESSFVLRRSKSASHDLKSRRRVYRRIGWRPPL